MFKSWVSERLAKREEEREGPSVIVELSNCAKEQSRNEAMKEMAYECDGTWAIRLCRGRLVYELLGD